MPARLLPPRAHCQPPVTSPLWYDCGQMGAAAEKHKSAYRVGKNPNSLANLRPPYSKGQTGNPHGRPPAGESFNDALRYFLDLPPASVHGLMLVEWQLPPERNNMRHVLAYAQVMASMWEQGSRTFTMNKLDGLPKQAIELQTADNDPWLKLQQEIARGNRKPS